MQSSVRNDSAPMHGALNESGSRTGAADMEEHWRTYRGFVGGLKRVLLLVAAILLGMYFWRVR